MTTPEQLREQGLQVARKADKNTAARRRTRIIISLVVLLGAANVYLLAVKVNDNAETIQTNMADAQVAKNKANIAKLLAARNDAETKSTLRLARGTRTLVQRTNTVLRREGFPVPGARGRSGAEGAVGAAGTASTVPGPKGDKGDMGDSVTGPAGAKGDKGDKGEAVVGAMGTNGQDGAAGAAAPPVLSIQTACPDGMGGFVTGFATDPDADGTYTCP